MRVAVAWPPILPITLLKLGYEREYKVMRRRNSKSIQAKRKRRSKTDMAAVKQMVIETTESLKSYWPLTLRQIYYQLVANNTIETEINSNIIQL